MKIKTSKQAIFNELTQFVKSKENHEYFEIDDFGKLRHNLLKHFEWDIQQLIDFDSRLVKQGYDYEPPKSNQTYTVWGQNAIEDPVGMWQLVDRKLGRNKRGNTIPRRGEFTKDDRFEQFDKAFPEYFDCCEAQKMIDNFIDNLDNLKDIKEAA